jgi:mitochondrial fission protein ELM1
LNESVGLQSHAIAVAQAVGLPFELKRLEVGGPLRFLPASLQVYLSPARLLASVASSEPFGLSWPRLIIAIGRRSVPVALSLKSQSKLSCFALHIRNSKWLEREFDLFVIPMKRGLKGANVMTTFDAVYSVSTMNHTVRQEADPSSGAPATVASGAAVTGPATRPAPWRA